MTSTGGSAKPLSSTALRELVSGLAGKIDRLEQEVEQLRLDNSNLHLDNQALKDEIARLKHLPPRPPFKSSGVTLPLTLRFVALDVEKRHSLPLKARCRSGLFAAL